MWLRGSLCARPTGSATFLVHELNETGVVLLLGDKGTRTTLSWECLEGITEFLSLLTFPWVVSWSGVSAGAAGRGPRGGGWVRGGGGRGVWKAEGRRGGRRGWGLLAFPPAVGSPGGGGGGG